jgi:hypothetical protein
MFTITHNFAPAQPLLRHKPEEKTVTEQREKFARTVEPETRLWKVTGKTVEPKFFRSELLILSIFLAVVVSATAVSVQEMSRLMRSDAIEHVTARALEGAK